MTKLFLVFAMATWTFSCTQSNNRQSQRKVLEKRSEIHHYSKSISDSLSIFINLPNDYDRQKKKRYPVVYLLDANLYFDIVASVIDKYSEVGLAPSAILVGIGYKDFQTMDSLRNRDYTYPVAMPEYDMPVSGGAEKFLQCIQSELIPLVDKGYNTDTTKEFWQDTPLEDTSLLMHFCTRYQLERKSLADVSLQVPPCIIIITTC